MRHGVIQPIRHQGRGLVWFAAACLVAGWLHAWLHDVAAHADDHFDSEASEACQLAVFPPSLLAAAPNCPLPRAWRVRSVRTALAAPEYDRSLRVRIRAPPHI